MWVTPGWWVVGSHPPDVHLVDRPAAVAIWCTITWDPLRTTGCNGPPLPGSLCRTCHALEHASPAPGRGSLAPNGRQVTGSGTTQRPFPRLRRWRRNSATDRSRRLEPAACGGNPRTMVQRGPASPPRGRALVGTLTRLGMLLQGLIPVPHRRREHLPTRFCRPSEGAADRWGLPVPGSPNENICRWPSARHLFPTAGGTARGGPQGSRAGAGALGGVWGTGARIRRECMGPLRRGGGGALAAKTRPSHFRHRRGMRWRRPARYRWHCGPPVAVRVRHTTRGSTPKAVRLGPGLARAVDADQSAPEHGPPGCQVRWPATSPGSPVAAQVPGAKARRLRLIPPSSTCFRYRRSDESTERAGPSPAASHSSPR